MGEQLAVRGKLIVLAVVAAGIGAAAAMFTPTLHSTPKARSNAAPVVMRVARPVAQRPARLRHVFRPPVVRVRTVNALPPTGFGLGPVVALALALVAAGLLFRLLSADL